MATIKIHPVGADKAQVIDSVGAIEINGVMFTPEMIAAMGDHPERVLSFKRATNANGKTVLKVKTVRLMDDAETKAVWSDATTATATATVTTKVV